MSAASPASLPRRSVLADALPGSLVRDLLLVVAGAAFMALMAQVAIRVPGTVVPITGQTLAVGLVGATMGVRRGTGAMVLYALVGLALPVYADGGSGFDVIWGASGGYIVGFILAAAAIGWLAERGADRKVLAAFAAFVVGQLLVFGIGVPWLKVSLDVSWSKAVAEGFTPFIFGGAVKAAMGAAVLPSAWALVRKAEGSR